MSEQQTFSLKINPDRFQLHRFIIWHTHTYVNGSSFRMEQFSRWLGEKEIEYSETKSITLDNEYLIESWTHLVENNFVLDDDFDIHKEVFT